MQTTWYQRYTRHLLLAASIYAAFVMSSAFASLPSASAKDEAQNRLVLSLDYAQFRASDQRSYLEIYYALPQSELGYVPNSAGGFSCQVVLALQIFHQETLWASKLWKIEKAVKDTAEISADLQLVDMLRYILEKPGSYRMSLHAKDVNRQKLDSVSVTFDAYDFSPEELQLSDVELATRIQKLAPDSTTVFVKNKMEVVPNPGLIYGENSPMLYYYFEAYNLFKGVSGGRYKTRCLIKDSGGRMVEGLMNPDRTKIKTVDASVEMGMVNVASLPSGTYALSYGIADSSGQLLAGREKKFYVYNPSLAPMAQQEGGRVFPPGTVGPLGALSDAELDNEFELMQHLTGKDERKFYKSLQNASAKREFLFSLWSDLKSRQGLSGMAFRQQYLERVEKANAEYGTAFRPGWKTDRGRVFVLYGPPSTVERFSSTSETKPYEIWTYQHLEGGVIFVFADRYGFRNYEHLHSTLRGEISNPNWQSLIRTGPGLLRPNQQQPQ
jgi:GWxTD domain-containing protein